MLAVIAHPPGEEVQWDWVELPTHPRTGTPVRTRICWSGRGLRREGGAGCWPSPDQPHLIEALHAMSGCPGGLSTTWRFDRMATVASPNTGRDELPADLSRSLWQAERRWRTRASGS